MLTLIACIFVFCLIVFIHELGHFLLAKWTGMRVEEFAIGMGPLIWSKQIGETKYSVRAFPLGGYNKIAGMSEEEDLDERSFVERPRYQQFLVIVAGPVFNILLAIVLAFAVYAVNGVNTPTNQPVIGAVIPGSPAALTQMQPGDRIVSIGGKEIHTFADISPTITPLAHSAFDVVIDRNGKEQTIRLTAVVDKGRSVIGIAPTYEHTSFTLPEAARESLRFTASFTVGLVQSVGSMISGHEKAEVAGPIGIVQVIGSAATHGFWSVVMLTAILSINLGVFNLFPLPVLDGGRLVLILMESIARRRLPAKALFYIQTTGVVLLLGLMVYATFNDITRLL